MSKFRRVSPALGVWGEHENLCGADGLFLFLGIEESLAYGKITLSSKFTFMRHSMSTSSSRFEFGENSIMSLIPEKNTFPHAKSRNKKFSQNIQKIANPKNFHVTR